MGATGLAYYRSDQGHPKFIELCGLLLAVTRASSGLLLRGCASHESETQTQGENSTKKRVKYEQMYALEPNRVSE